MGQKFRRNEAVEVHYEWEGAFWIQPCRARSCRKSDDLGHVNLEPDGERTRSDQRLTERVDACLAGATVRVDDSPACLVLNASEHGIALVSTRQYELGQKVDIRLDWNGKYWSGQASVKRVYSSQDGSTIYGLRAATTYSGVELREGLARIVATLKFQSVILCQSSTETPNN